MPHDVLMIGWIMNFRKEARQCVIKAAEFVDQMQSTAMEEEVT